jgi:hypothetical protein
MLDARFLVLVLLEQGHQHVSAVHFPQHPARQRHSPSSTTPYVLGANS